MKKPKQGSAGKKVKKALKFENKHNFYQQLFKKSTTSSKTEAVIKNAIYIKEEGHNHVWKLPVENNCTDYWVLQHYKIQDMLDELPDEECNVTKCTVRLRTSENNLHDANFMKMMNNAIRTGLTRLTYNLKTTATNYEI